MARSGGKLPLAVGLLALIAVSAYYRLSHRPSDSPAPATVVEAPGDRQGQGSAQAPSPAPPVAPAGAASVPPKDPGAGAPSVAPAAPAAARDDLVAMQTLRELLNSEPRRAIELARQANRRAPDSPDAAERGWIIVKALASLKRFHEARDEAATLVSRHPDSSWALDAKRHMLVHPLDLPSREEQQKQMQQEQPPPR